jgi:hypothetical protein
MPIAIACRHCDWKGKVKDELAGKKGKCPTCGEVVPIPNTPGLPSGGKRASVDDEPDVVDEADFVEESPRPRVKPKSKSLDEAFSSVGRDDGDRPRSRRRDDDEDDERPRRRRPADDDDEDRPARGRRRDDDEDDRPRRRRPADDDERPSRSRRRRDDDEEDRPRRKRRVKRRRRPKKSGISGKRIGAIVGGLFALVVGSALLLWFLLGDGRRIIYPILAIIGGIIGIFQGVTGAGLGEDEDRDNDDDDDDDGGDDGDWGGDD